MEKLLPLSASVKPGYFSGDYFRLGWSAIGLLAGEPLGLLVRLLQIRCFSCRPTNSVKALKE